MIEEMEVGILLSIEGNALGKLGTIRQRMLKADVMAKQLTDTFDALGEKIASLAAPVVDLGSAFADTTANMRAMTRVMAGLGTSSQRTARFLDAVAASSASTGAALDAASVNADAMAVQMDTLAASAAAVKAAMADAAAGARLMGRVRMPVAPVSGMAGTGSPYVAPMPEPREKPKGHGHLGTVAAGVASVGAGIYQYNDVAEALARIQMTRDTTSGLALYRSAMEREYAQYGYASLGKFDPFGEAMNKIVQLMPRFAPSRQVSMFSEIAPYAASEAMIKHIPFSEAMESFIEVMHMAGAYTPQKMRPLENSILTMSKVTPMNLGRITNTLSYALPVATGMGIPPSVVMMQMAAMMQAGIRNSKSGTWLADLYLNAMPQILGSGLFKNKNQVSALTSLHLLKGKHMEFLNSKGQMDATKLLTTLAADRQKMSSLKYTSMVELAFGKQGARAVMMLTEPFVMKNLEALVKLDNSHSAPEPQAMKKTPGGAWENLWTQTKSLWMASGKGASGPFTNAENWMAAKIHAALPWARSHPDVTEAGLGVASMGAAYTLGAAWFHKEVLGKLLFKEAPTKLAEAMKLAGKGAWDTAEKLTQKLVPGLRLVADKAPDAADRLLALGGRLIDFSNVVADFLMLVGYSGGLSRKGDTLYNGKQLAAFTSRPTGTPSFVHVPSHLGRGARDQLDAVHAALPFVQVHTHINLDGQHVADVVTQHQINAAGARTGPSQYAPFSTMPYPQNPAPTGG